MKKNLCLLYGIAFLQGMVFYSPAAVLYRQDAGLTLFQISVIESISLFLCFALEIPWGILADKIGYRLTMSLCCLMYFVSKIIFWEAWTFQDFLLERIFLSIAVSGLSGVDITLLYLYAPEGKSQKVFGIYEGMGTSGLLAAAVCFSFFLENHWRRAAFLTAAAYGLAFILALFLRKPDSQRAEKPSGKARKLSLKLSPNVLCLVSPSFLLFLSSAGLLTETRQYITVFLNQPQYIACGLSAGTIALLYILTQIAGIISPWSDCLTKKFGIPLFSAGCFLCPALLCFVLAFTHSPVCTAICILGIQSFVSLFQPLQSELQNREISTSHRAAALSLQAMFLELTSAALEPVFGYLAQKSLAFAFGAGGIFCTGGFLLFLLWYGNFFRKPSKV